MKALKSAKTPEDFLAVVNDAAEQFGSFGRVNPENPGFKPVLEAANAALAAFGLEATPGMYDEYILIRTDAAAVAERKAASELSDAIFAENSARKAQQWAEERARLLANGARLEGGVVSGETLKHQYGVGDADYDYWEEFFLDDRDGSSLSKIEAYAMRRSSMQGVK
jgi:hypothetical protein